MTQTRVNHDDWSVIEESVTVARSPRELYAIWRDFERLPDILSHVKMVRADTPRRSHWVVEGPAGSDIAWESSVIEDIPGQKIRWRSGPDAEVENEGTVEFVGAPDGDSAEVLVHMSYRAPAGALGDAVATLFGKDPGKQVREDLRNFKERVEAGTFASAPA